MDKAQAAQSACRQAGEFRDADSGGSACQDELHPAGSVNKQGQLAVQFAGQLRKLASLFSGPGLAVWKAPFVEPLQRLYLARLKSLKITLWRWNNGLRSGGNSGLTGASGAK